MPTYYEMLKLEPAANTSEIEDAIDEQYHKWRRLVTHHDPKVVNQANEALQTLETIRATLTNPEQRRIYDAAIGVGEKVMGLGDPDAVMAQVGPSSSAQPPPAPMTTQEETPPSKRVDAWVCPECDTPNSIGLRYCNECGAQIGAECTQCGELVEMAAKFCAACGVNQEDARYEAELERQAEVRSEIETLNKRLKEARDVVSLLERVASTGKSAKNFKKTRFKDLIQHVPDVEDLGCAATAITLIGGGFLTYLFGTWGMSSFFGAFVLGMLIAGFAGGMLNTLVQRQRRKKAAFKALPEHRERVAALEQQIKELQSTLPPKGKQSSRPVSPH